MESSISDTDPNDKKGVSGKITKINALQNQLKTTQIKFNAMLSV